MNWIKPFTKLAVLPTALLALASVALAQDPPKELTPESKKQTLEKLEYILTKVAYVPGADFSKWSEKISSKKEDIDKATTPTQFANIVNGILVDYRLSHISLFTPDFGTQRITQKRAGIGIRIQIEEGGVRVTNVFPDSPATDVGLQKGDLIIECDGKAVKGVAELSGEQGQKSTITFTRGDKKIVKEVTRREYKTVIPESVEWQGDIAVVTVPTFDVGYDAKNVEKIMDEVAKKAKGVVLDLRGNGGGRVTSLQHLAAYFIDPVTEPMGTFINRGNVDTYTKDYGATTDVTKIAEKTPFKVRASRFGTDRQTIKKLEVPVSVLIDGGSGSASEMMAAALKEIRKAPVVGSPSAGAVLASMIVPMGDEAGFWIQYPVMDYVTIKGTRLEGNGVKPDVMAPITPFGQPDKGLIEATKLVQALIKGGKQDGN